MKNKILILVLICSVIIRSNAQSYPEMIKVVGGTFIMGDSGGEARINEQPKHKVSLKTFFIAKTETTVAQWRIYCDETGVNMGTPPSWGWIDNDPITNVNWSQAVSYCEWLSEKTGMNYSLPTEAEWEFAARGGNLSKGYKYSGGISLPMVGYYGDNSNLEYYAVAQKRANELGIFDMSGNVLEWCKDWYGNYSKSSQINPQGVKKGVYRIIRGGRAFDLAYQCRVSYRGYNAPWRKNSSLGFRVVLSSNTSKKQ